VFPPTPALARFDLGRVIERMFAAMGANLAVFALLSLILAGIPAALTGLVQLQAGALGGGGYLLSLIVSMAASALLQGSLIHATVSHLNGGRPSVGECLGTALRHLFPLVAIGLLVGIATLFGLLFFIVPGIIIALAFCVSAPVRVVETLGVFDSMGRSARLTSNHRGMIFVLFLLSVLVGAVISAVGFSVGTAVLLGASGSIFRLLIAPVLQSITSLIGAAGVASLYFELRTIKEGVGVEALAAIFD